MKPISTFLLPGIYLLLVFTGCEKNGHSSSYLKGKIDAQSFLEGNFNAVASCISTGCGGVDSVIISGTFKGNY